VNKEDTLTKESKWSLKIAKTFFLCVWNNMKLMIWKNWKESDGLPDRKSLPKTKLDYTIVKRYARTK
jgi:hypothetical protein